MENHYHYSGATLEGDTPVSSFSPNRSQYGLTFFAKKAKAKLLYVLIVISGLMLLNSSVYNCPNLAGGCIATGKAFWVENSDKVNVRAGQSENSKVIDVLVKGDVVYVHYGNKQDLVDGVKGRWVYATMADGSSGFIWGWDLSNYYWEKSYPKEITAWAEYVKFNTP